MLTILLVIAILVFLIVVHELGHFIVAKLAGVKVEEFGIGYPPRAFTLAAFGGTVYTLNWIPFGGFVRLFGDEGEGQRGAGSFVDAPRWKQGLILAAGVCMNAVAAWALFAFALHAGVPQAVDAPLPGEKTQLIVTDVVPGSPAQAAGIVPGDRIAGVEDVRSHEALAALAPDQVVDFVRSRGGRKISVAYLRDGAASSASMIPANAVIPQEAGRPALGIALAFVATRPEGWGASARDALFETRNAFEQVAGNLLALAREALRGAPDLSQIAGPVGIVSYVGEASQSGFGSVLLLAGLISVNLAIFNLAPIPALDGGRLVVLLLETATRRNAPRLAVEALNALGVALIVLLMAVVTYHDIARLIT